MKLMKLLLTLHRRQSRRLKSSQTRVESMQAKEDEAQAIQLAQASMVTVDNTSAKYN